jgi:hypothetical protein
MLLYICPYTTIYVSSCYYICVPILLHMCPHTIIINVSAYYYICVLILLYLCAHLRRLCCWQLFLPLYMCAHTTINVSSYYYMCVLILLYMCPHATTYMSSYYYLCSHTTAYVSAYYHICVLIYAASAAGKRVALDKRMCVIRPPIGTNIVV